MDDFDEFAMPSNALAVQQAAAQIDALVAKQIEIEKEVERLTQETEHAKDKLNMISRVQLPALLEEIQQTKWTTKDGVKISLKNSLKAAITEEKSEAALSWLKDQGYGSVVKHKIELEYGQGSLEEAKKMLALIAETSNPDKVNSKETVHPMTLASLCREMVEKGVDIPDDLFSVYRHKQTKILTK